MNNVIRNNLILIENGQLTVYQLDDQLKWKIGRESKDNNPDIKLFSSTISRKHGEIENVNGIWFYIDHIGKNGTIYNGKHIEAMPSGKKNPIFLNSGDILIFGGGSKPAINSKTVWALFLKDKLDEVWRVEDTKNIENLAFSDGNHITQLHHPEKGTVIYEKNGIAIYMGDISYLNGKIYVQEEKTED